MCYDINGIMITRSAITWGLAQFVDSHVERGMLRISIPELYIVLILRAQLFAT